jgi:hypothetical protein
MSVLPNNRQRIRASFSAAKNKSQLFRDMFLLYKEQTLEREFFELQRYGTKLARGKGVLTEEDVERIVFEGR